MSTTIMGNCNMNLYVTRLSYKRFIIVFQNTST